MQRYFMQLCYLGTHYNGWQQQPSAPSVQQTIEKTLQTLLKTTTPVVGVGRTDTGVHAQNYIAHFDAPHTITNPNDFIYHCNAILPTTISIDNLWPVTPEAHARFSALERSYCYNIALKKLPFLHQQSWLYQRPLNLEAMQLAANSLLQYNDFTSFTKLHSDTKNNLCNITHASWTQQNNLLQFNITANRFLRNMVRAIVGTLVDVGNGKITPKQFCSIIEKQNRAQASCSAPAQGLTFTGAKYPSNLYH